MSTFWPDILLTVMFWALIGISLINSYTGDPLNHRKQGFAFLCALLFALLTYFTTQYSIFNYSQIFPLAHIGYLAIFGGACIAGAALLTNQILTLWLRWRCRRRKTRIEDGIPNHHRDKLGRILRIGRFRQVLLLIMVCLGVPLIVLVIPEGVWQVPITIEPKNYQAKLAFWGGFGNITNPTVAASLNAHNATLIQCNFPNVDTIEGKASFIDMMTYFNNSLPNISIYLAVPGRPGGYVWDGSANGTIAYAKTLVTEAHANNLTNIKGLAFDMEFPIAAYAPGVDLSPNQQRHDQSLALWDEFFTWMDSNAPEMKLNIVNYVESGIDVLDGDYDLHYIRRYSFMESDHWSECAPMLYRCWYWGPKPFGSVPTAGFIEKYVEGGHYFVYNNLRLLAQACDTHFGDRGKMGVYLGLTNCTCYGRDVVQYMNGQEAGYGYDSLVRDALIAKHFNVPTITIFLYTTAMENGYSMGGVFDVWGADFLDIFNASINGPESNKPFQIWYQPRFNYALTFGALDAFVFDNQPLLDSIAGLSYIGGLFFTAITLTWYQRKRSPRSSL